MDLFDCLLVGHLVGDYLLQSRWMADKKSSGLAPLLVHSLVYSLTVYLFARVISPLSPLLLLLIFASHCIIDHRALTAWIVRNVNQAHDLPWFQMVIDQVLHVLILFLVAWYAVSVA